MSNLYQTLEEVLVHKIALYSEIIEVMNDEWKSVSEYSRENLEKALQCKEILLAKVHELNQKREEVIRLISEQVGQHHPGLTLKDIIGLKENHLGNSMAVQRKKIIDQIQMIKELNAANKQLINRSALAMKQSMSWLYEIDTDYTPYYSNGQLSEPTMGSRVVNTDA